MNVRIAEYGCDAMTVRTTRRSGWDFRRSLAIDERHAVINQAARVTPTRYRGWF
jgi:hypothetical protein